MGFEPTVPVAQYTAFRERHLQPLRHLSSSRVGQNTVYLIELKRSSLGRLGVTLFVGELEAMNFLGDFLVRNVIKVLSIEFS